jgi:hypothetical protein
MLSKHWEYLKYVLRHKRYVYCDECRARNKQHSRVMDARMWYFT